MDRFSEKTVQPKHPKGDRVSGEPLSTSCATSWRAFSGRRLPVTGRNNNTSDGLLLSPWSAAPIAYVTFHSACAGRRQVDASLLQ